MVTAARISAFGLVVFFWLVAAGNVAAAALDTCLAKPFTPAQLTCLTDLAKAQDDVNVCTASSEAVVRWMCVANFAEHKRAVEICRILIGRDPDQPRLTYELCRVQFAIGHRKPELCRNLTTANLADACILQMVQRGSGRDLCASISNPVLRSVCRSD